MGRVRCRRPGLRRKQVFVDPGLVWIVVLMDESMHSVPDWSNCKDCKESLVLHTVLLPLYNMYLRGLEYSAPRQVLRRGFASPCLSRY